METNRVMIIRVINKVNESACTIESYRSIIKDKARNKTNAAVNYTQLLHCTMSNDPGKPTEIPLDLEITPPVARG